MRRSLHHNVVAAPDWIPSWATTCLTQPQLIFLLVPTTAGTGECSEHGAA
jgi:hypothetical protein